MRRLPLHLLLVALLVPVLASAPAQAEGTAPTAAPSIQPVTPTVNGITQAAVQQGILNCAGRINQVSNFLGFNAQSGAVLMTPPSTPDQRLIPLAMEIPTEGGSAYVAVDFAPNQANGCGAAYEAVAFWPQKCDAVAAKQFSAFKKSGQLKKDITVLDGGVSTKVFLMPAGSGCVSIKKEVVL